MGLKGRLAPNHIPDNLFEMTVPGYPGPLPVTKMSGIEHVIEAVDLPDKTRRSGGQIKAGTFTIEIPEHELLAQAFMEQWASDNVVPVKPTALRPVSLNFPSVAMSIATSRTLGLEKCWPEKGKHGDRDMGSDGKMTVVEWTISYDQRLPA